MKPFSLAKWVGIYVAGAITYGFLVFFLAPSIEKAGQFGDMFGGFSAFFTGLGFLGIAYTIFLQGHSIKLQSTQVEMQAEELRLQREELQRTREELARSAEAHQTSERNMHQQIAMMRYSAQLAAIPLILEPEMEHLRAAHSNEVGNRPESQPDGFFDQKIREVEARVTTNQPRQNDHCLLRNLKDISKLRRDARDLYRKLSDG
jgi:hypothetical protein